MINQKLALSMMMNNLVIYHKLLKRFYDKYKDYPDYLKKKYNDNDKDFYYIVHDIKGISLNLGASKLFEISDLINHLYKNKEIVEEKIVDEFIIELKLVILEIKEIINGSKNEI